MKKYDINPAAFVVVVVLGLISLWFGFIAGWLYLHGNTEEAKDAGLAMGATTTPLIAILARHRSDPTPDGTPTDPVNVTLPDEPVQVTPVPADVHPDAPAESDL